MNSTIGAGVETLINGDGLGDFGDNFVNRAKTGAVMAVGAEVTSEFIGKPYHEAQQLNNGDAPLTADILQIAGHGIVGCGLGAATSGNCGAGALGAVAGELAGEAYVNSGGTNMQTGLDAAQLAGAAAALVAGGDADDVNAAAQIGHNAAENNVFFIPIVVAAVAANILVAGDGDVAKGLAVVGDGNDPMSKAIQSGVQSGVELSMEHFPEATQSTLSMMMTMGDTVNDAVIYWDDATGNRVSSTWGALDPTFRNQLVGGGKSVSVIFSAASASRFISSASKIAKVEVPSSTKKIASTSENSNLGKVDFYVKSDGTAVKSTGYRAIVGDNNINEALMGTISARNPATYFTFDNITNLPKTEMKNLLQLPRTPSHVAQFDTLQIINDINIPNGEWGTNGIPEPITYTMPKWGNGGGTQAITSRSIEVNKLIKVKK